MSAPGSPARLQVGPPASVLADFYEVQNILRDLGARPAFWSGPLPSGPVRSGAEGGGEEPCGA